MLRPALRDSTFSCRWTDQFFHLRHFEAHFPFDDLSQGDVCVAHVLRIENEGPAHSAVTRIKLADTARDQVYQDVRFQDNFECFLYKFRIHAFFAKPFYTGDRMGRGIVPATGENLLLLQESNTVSEVPYHRMNEGNTANTSCAIQL